jgi:hypothetical protein
MKLYFAELDAQVAKMTSQDKADCRAYFKHLDSISDAAQTMANATPTCPNPATGPMTRARAKALQEKVSSLLSMCEFDVPLDGNCKDHTNDPWSFA